MEIEDIVTGALAPAEKADPEAEEIITENIILHPGAMFDLISRAREAIAEDHTCAWERVSRIVAYNISSSLSRSESRNVLLLLHAERAASGDEDSILWVQEILQGLGERMKEAEQSRRRTSVVGSFSGSLDYLSDLFGEETINTLAALTGAKRPTVKRWLAGRAAQWRNSNKISSFARSLYGIIEEQGWGTERTLTWLYAPLASGLSPFELWSENSWMVPLELREELERIGV